MSTQRDHERPSWRKALRVRCGSLAIGLLSGGIGAAVATPVAAQVVPPPAAISNAFTPSFDPASQETAQGHGSVSVGYQNTYINGMFLPVPGGKAAVGSIRVQSISFDLDYFFADRWSAHLGIPYIESRYRGEAPHCITQAPPQCQGAVVPSQPHPESSFLDDGRYHGTWQDWSLGISYLASLGGYMLIPSLTANIPSHDYTFFANAAVGQDIWRIEPALERAVHHG